VALHAPGTDAVAEFDVASAGVMSEGVLAAMTAHLSRERVLGGYPAAAEAVGVITQARSRLATLAGMPGAGVEFVGNGTEAVRALVEAWPLTPGEAVLVPRSEFLSNRLALDRLVARRGATVVELAEGGDGRLDTATLEESVREHPAGLVVISQVASQRGVVQPLGDLLGVAAAAGVPVVVDVCQSLGHLPAVAGAAAVAGTSRKWLHGPRGVGFVVVAQQWRRHLAGPPTLHSHIGAGGDVRADPDVALFEPGEAPVAARVGLAAAVAELVAAGPAAVTDRLAALGPALRGLLLERVPGLPLGEPVDEPSAIVTIRTTEPGQARAVVAALGEDGLRANVVPAGRALDVDADIARLAPAPWVTPEHLERAAKSVRRAYAGQPARA
jgi:pyridoxal 5-phosphate dependent beta-lyase